MATGTVDSERNEYFVRDDLPDAVLVESSLERVRSSAEFVRSERMVRFLLVVVQHALQDRRDRLTERSPGCEVFDRPADWDPSIDTIVRSEARRLRTKLEQYYERQGKLDPIRITIPKGGYVPQFEPGTSGNHVSSPARDSNSDLCGCSRQARLSDRRKIRHYECQFRDWPGVQSGHFA
jgi:hypothetical protein